MSLADEIRRLETLLQREELSSDDFEARIADLIRAASASTDTTRPDLQPATARLGSLGAGPTPTHIGAYELVELLGQGGMGAVYLAKHILKPGLFAVKVPRYELLAQPGFGLRFKREASVGLRLEHAGIVRVHDLVIDGDWAAIVMDFVAGPNLETLLRNQGGPLPLARVLDLMIQTLDAMDYAHQQGVVHGDLKPKNLIVRPNGQLQVTDFGIARLVGTDDAQAGSVVGTGPYMAPELYRGGDDLDHRADIYALGMTLYKLLVGHLPFQRDMDAWQVLQAKQAGRVPLPAGLRSQLPEPLLAVIDRAIAPDPRERFAGCADFKDALVDASGHDWEPRVWAPLSPSKPEPVTTGAGYTQYAILAVLVALLVAVIWVGLAMHSEPGAEVATRTTPTPTTPAPSSPTPPPMQTTPPLAPAVSPTHETPTPSPTLRPAATPRVTPIRPSPTPEPVEVSTPPPSPAPTEARVRAQPTPVTEAPKMGLLYLTTEPKCLVEIDERTWTSEQTRMGLLFPPGRYTVRFVCDDPICDGFERRSGVKTLQVLAGDDTRYHADFHEINRR